MIITLPVVLSASIGRQAQGLVQGLASLGSIGLGLWMMIQIGLSRWVF